MATDRPDITPTEIHAVLRRYYGMEGTILGELKSFEARNFLIQIQTVGDSGTTQNQTDSCTKQQNQIGADSRATQLDADSSTTQIRTPSDSHTTQIQTLGDSHMTQVETPSDSCMVVEVQTPRSSGLRQIETSSDSHTTQIQTPSDSRTTQIETSSDSHTTQIETPADSQTTKCVLKFVPGIEPTTLMLQFECMQHLQNHGFVCSQPIAQKDGKLFAQYHSEQTDCLVYMLTYIPGEVVQKYVTNPADMFAIGSLVVDVQKCLATFSPQSDGNFNWFVDSIPDLANFLSDLENDHQRALVTQGLRVFEQNFEKIRHLEKGWVHGDLHDENVIKIDHTNQGVEIDKPNAKSSSPETKDITQEDKIPSCNADSTKDHAKITDIPHSFSSNSEEHISITDMKDVQKLYGIIDFENMSDEYRIMELVVPMAVFMMSVDFDFTNSTLDSDKMNESCNEEHKFRNTTFLQTSGHILAGYLSKQTLTLAENDALYPLVITRYLQELVWHSVQHKEQDGKNAYLTEIFPNAWPQLEILLACGQEGVWEVWNNVLHERV